jgi:hypothetical protein
MVRPNDHTPGGTLAGMLDDIEVLKRRTARLLPERLLPGGYDNATSYRGTTAERNLIYGIPATDPERVALANRKINYFNTDLGWYESYYAVTGLAGLTAKGLVAGTASGWYPIGYGPEILLQPTATFGATAGNYIGGWPGVVTRNGGAAWFNQDATGIHILQAGYYDLAWWTNQQTGSGAADYHSRLNNSTDTAVMWMSNVGGTPLSASLFTRSEARYESIAVSAGWRFRVICVSGALTVHMVTTGPTGRAQMLARYVRPMLVSD